MPRIIVPHETFGLGMYACLDTRVGENAVPLVSWTYTAIQDVNEDTLSIVFPCFALFSD